MNERISSFKTNKFRFESQNNILEEKDLGICADRASVLTPEHSFSALRTLQACPYTNTGFHLDVLIGGERIKAKQWTWLPSAMHRRGESDAYKVESITAVVPGMRTVVEKITVTNQSGIQKRIPVQIMFRGLTQYLEEWVFAIPAAGDFKRASYRTEENRLTAFRDGCAYVLTSSLPDMRLFASAYLWENELEIGAGETKSFYVSAHTGKETEATEEAVRTQKDYEEMLRKSFLWLEEQTAWIDKNLPSLSSDDKALDNLFVRSLVTYILSRWEIPELAISPYYSTGSINGGCMCSYLWDYCGGLMLHPIADPDTNEKELLAFLKNDLTTSFALTPVKGGKWGPWYQVNQEKIICMVYYHVLFTGRKEFLFKKAGEKTVLEWMRYCAYVCDTGTEEDMLFDYGEDGKAHLELRREFVYNGIMPDVNARRYMNYMRVYELTKVAGAPDENLPIRAAKLKERLKDLWNENEKWYDFINADGKRDIRYTVQMFKFLSSGVIDKKEREGLISHLNETEFLSQFGLHSMSKLDEAYDQNDIDNGGGGICTHFTMQICAQLYETGYDALATDILKRVYWWGTRQPYMGDSNAANMMLNREDTPLQGDISSVSCAQMIFYYIFGIRADFDGNITVSPVKNRPAENMRVDNARLCGKVFSVSICGDTFAVVAGGKVYEEKIGNTVYVR